MSQLLGCVCALYRHRLVRNIFALYVLKVVNQLLPLAVIPFLARVLGSTEWGRVAMAQALAMWGITVIRYGFPPWLLGPINTAMMPRLTRLIDSSPERARRSGGQSAALVVVLM